MQTRREADDGVRGAFQGMSEDSLRPFIDTGPFYGANRTVPCGCGSQDIKEPILKVLDVFCFVFFLRIILNLVHLMIFYH